MQWMLELQCAGNSAQISRFTIASISKRLQTYRKFLSLRSIGLPPLDAAIHSLTSMIVV
jgi:hypothetical protein